MLEQQVVDVVAGVALVRGQVDGAVDEDGQVRVDLDQALQIALVPVVATPGLARHVFQRERLFGRHLQLRGGAPARFRDGSLEYRVEFFLRE